MDSWLPIRVDAAGLQPHLRREWTCDVAWDVQAVYAGPDETLTSADGSVQRAVFWNRHIDRRFHIDYPPTRRETPRVGSRTWHDPDGEWELVQATADRYLGAAGLDRGNDPEAIARCLAASFEYEPWFKLREPCPTFSDNPRELHNGLEALVYQSFCVGCAHALAILADACGLPARTVGLGAHRVAEIRIDGRWHMTENSCRHADSQELASWFPASFHEVPLHPDRYADLMPAGKPAKYLRTSNAQYHFMGGMWQSSETLRLAAGNAFALYPELDRWGLKSDDRRRLPILMRANGFYWQDVIHGSDDAAMQDVYRRNTPWPLGDTRPGCAFLYTDFNPGDTLRQSFQLDGLADLEAIELTLPMPPVPALDDSQLGTGLLLAVNDDQRPLAAWGIADAGESVRTGHRHLTIALPPGAFQADAVNWLQLTNETGRRLHAPVVPAAMEPYIPPLFRA